MVLLWDRTFKIEGARRDGYRIGLFALGDDDDKERDFYVVRGFNDKMNSRILDVFGLLLNELKGDVIHSQKYFLWEAVVLLSYLTGLQLENKQRIEFSNLVRKGNIQSLRLKNISEWWYLKVIHRSYHRYICKYPHLDLAYLSCAKSAILILIKTFFLHHQPGSYLYPKICLVLRKKNVLSPISR
mgnify:CR=1 FL=1